MANFFRSFGRIRGVNIDARTVDIIASTGKVARDNAVIDQTGWDLRFFEQNPVVLWSHDDLGYPVAKALSTRVEDGNLVQTHEFATHQAANDVWDMVRGGFINATSVRWLPGEYEWRNMPGGDSKQEKILVFTKGHQLLEVSYVNIPADPGALVLRSDGEPFDISQFPDKETVQREEIAARAEADVMALLNRSIQNLSGGR